MLIDRSVRNMRVRGTYRTYISVKVRWAVRLNVEIKIEDLGYDELFTELA